MKRLGRQNQELTPLRTDPFTLRVGTFLLCGVCAAHLASERASSQIHSSNLEVTPEYRDAVGKLMIAEANHIAAKLILPEATPIRREALTELFVSPPALTNAFGGLGGAIRTKRFSYAFALGGKLSSLGRLDVFPQTLSNKELTEAYRKIAVPESQIDTNAAWQAMSPYLNAGILDVERLNRECKFRLKFLKWADLNVPIYSASWSHDGETVASLAILLPEKTLLSLRIEEPKFNLRPSFRMPKTK